MLLTGYNLVHGRAIEEFRTAFTHRFDLPQPETLSAVSLLRYLHRKSCLPHRVVQVVGFHELWRACPDPDGLARLLSRLFFDRMNWLQNENPFIYFVLPDEVTFNDAAHLCLRLSPDLYADMTAVFGHMRQVTSDHYHHNFTVSEV